MKRTKQKSFSKDKLYIGIDNGVSGSIGWTDGIVKGQIKTPVFKQQNYTKVKGNISRIDHCFLMNWLKDLTTNYSAVFIIIERPMVNPGRFKATISAVRAIESMQLILETLALPYQFVDSKEWQKDMLPKGVKGSDELKKASITVAKRLFPSIECKPDGDGILMAEWARRSNF